MRSFRRNFENLRDMRITYTFIISFALICAMLAVLASRLDDNLKRSELENYYESLSLCADALEAWSTADGAGERYAASLRFENAAAALPSEVKLEPILSLADYMRMGESAESRVRAFADTFALLSSIEYTDADEARRIISETLGSVSDKIFAGAAAVPNEAVTIPPPEVLSYTKRVAEGTVKKIFGGNSVGLEPLLSEDGSWVSQTENMRMTFSGADGSLEAFVFIRVGNASGSAVSEEEAISSALEFYKSTRRGSGGAKVVESTQACGFAVCDIVDGEEYWRATVDGFGRVWSLMKVKR